MGPQAQCVDICITNAFYWWTAERETLCVVAGVPSFLPSYSLESDHATALGGQSDRQTLGLQFINGEQQWTEKAAFEAHLILYGLFALECHSVLHGQEEEEERSEAFV